MKFNKHSKIEECVSHDPTRAVLHNVHLDVEAKSLVATNGHMIAIVPVEPEEGDVTGYVTPEALKAAREGGKFHEPSISCNSSLALPDGRSFPRPKAEDIGNYPNYKQVIPEADRQVAFTVRLNAEYLYSIAKAISDGKNTVVTLEFAEHIRRAHPDGTFTEHPQPIVVKGAGGKGVLMPCRMS